MSTIARHIEAGGVVLERLTPRWRRWGPRVVLGLGPAAAGTVLALLTRGLWFHGDDSGYLLTPGTVPGEDKGLWAPHGDHWSSAVVVVLFALLGRVGTRPWLAVATTWAVPFHGARAEAMLWDATMNQTGAVLFRGAQVALGPAVPFGYWYASSGFCGAARALDSGSPGRYVVCTP